MSRTLSLILTCLVATTLIGSEPAGLIENMRNHAESSVLVIAHRGDSGEYPENTQLSFYSAVAITAEMVELDFYQSSDGVLFCHHDETLDRTTDCEEVLGRTDVEPHTVPISDILRLDAGAWKDQRFTGTRIPTLEEALDTILEGSIPLIEHKAGDPEILVDLLRKKDLVDRVVVQSFDLEFLTRLRQLEPRIPIAALGSGSMTVDHLVQLKELRAEIVHWNHRDLTVDDISVLKRKGFLIFTYTVNHDIGLAGASILGVDGITTDEPNRLKGLIQLGHVRRRGS